jgi:hypothetical protein
MGIYSLFILWYGISKSSFFLFGNAWEYIPFWLFDKVLLHQVFSFLVLYWIIFHFHSLMWYCHQKERGRELEREPCRNTDTTSHGEHTDPTGIPSCLIFCLHQTFTLTTLWTHQHTTPWSLHINNLLKRRSPYRITKYRSLCLTSDQQTRNRLMSDP